MTVVRLDAPASGTGATLAYAVSAAPKRALVVCIGVDNVNQTGLATATCTYGDGAAITPVISALADGGGASKTQVAIWVFDEAYLAGAVGTTITPPSAFSAGWLIVAASYYNVDQTTPVPRTASDKTTTSTNPLTACDITAADGAAVCSISANSLPGQTADWSGSGGDLALKLTADTAGAAGGASYADELFSKGQTVEGEVGWTGNPARMAQVAVELMAAAPVLYWVADHENDNFTDTDWNDSLTGSQPTEVDFSLDTAKARTGSKSLKTQINTSVVPTGNIAVRMVLWQQIARGHTDVWFSSWVLFEANTNVDSGIWSIGDFKQLIHDGVSNNSEPTFSFNWIPVGTSQFRIDIRSKVDADGFSQSSTLIHTGTINANRGEWVHIEVHMKPSLLSKGVLETFINGAQDYKNTALTTMYDLSMGNPMGWSEHTENSSNAHWQYKLNNYATVNPTTLTPDPTPIWRDDVVLSSGRMWPIFQVSDIGRFRPNASADDASETATVVTLTGTTIVISASNTVGLRFPNVRIPPGAVIKSARLHFTGKAANSTAVTATIAGEAVANAAAFTATASNISNRTITTATVSWVVPGWIDTPFGGQYRNYRTDENISPDLTAIIQEIVDGGSWAKGNALALIITATGTGTRTFTAHDHVNLMPPDLYVVWEETIPPGPPIALRTPQKIVNLGRILR